MSAPIKKLTGQLKKLIAENHIEFPEVTAEEAAKSLPFEADEEVLECIRRIFKDLDLYGEHARHMYANPVKYHSNEMESQIAAAVLRAPKATPIDIGMELGILDEEEVLPEIIDIQREFKYDREWARHYYAYLGVHDPNRAEPVDMRSGQGPTIADLDARIARIKKDLAEGKIEPKYAEQFTNTFERRKQVRIELRNLVEPFLKDEKAS